MLILLLGTLQYISGVFTILLVLMAESINVNARMAEGIPRAVMNAALSSNNLNICHLNIQSLCARQMSKFCEFRDCFENSKIDIICLTESWLSDSIPDDVISIEGYNIIRNDREYSRGVVFVHTLKMI